MPRLCTLSEVKDWLDQLRISAEIPDFHRLGREERDAGQYFEDETPRKLAALARESIRWLLQFRAGESPGETKLVIHEHGIWESNEFRPLFGLIRSDSASIEEIKRRPGHIFAPTEFSSLGEALWLSMCFGWGVRIYARDVARIIQTDHDGHLWGVDLA